MKHQESLEYSSPCVVWSLFQIFHQNTELPLDTPSVALIAA